MFLKTDSIILVFFYISTSKIDFFKMHGRWQKLHCLENISFFHAITKFLVICWLKNKAKYVVDEVDDFISKRHKTLSLIFFCSLEFL